MKQLAKVIIGVSGFLLLTVGRTSAVDIPISLDLSQILIQDTITLNANPLPQEAFFGKNVVIPMEITSDVTIRNPQTVSAQMSFQLVDADGNPLGGWQSVPVQLQSDPKNKKRMVGTAIVSRLEVQAVRRGWKMNYYFSAKKAGQLVFLSPSLAGVSAGPNALVPPDSFSVSFIDTIQYPVSPSGGKFKAPDTYQVDGKTAVAFDPGALSGPGTLTIRQEDVETAPQGPGGLKPVNVFTLSLEGTSLVRTARVTLSYPANLDGTVGDSRYNWRDLALYRYNIPYGWELVSRPDTDPVMHTVTGTTSRFSLFALFPTGPVGAADLHAQERIITPNGDNINDIAHFNGLSALEEVQIFDIRGRRVRTVHGPPHVWDGRNDNGQVVESGVYLYQYVSQGERISGVIVVAK